MGKTDTRVILGASIGEQPGESAVAILYREIQPVGKPEVFATRRYKRGRSHNGPADRDEIGIQQALEHVYHVRHLERPKGDLADVIRRIIELLVSVRREGEQTICIVDATGVGHPAYAHLVGEIRALELDSPMYVTAREIVVSNALGGSGKNGDNALVIPRRDLISAGRLTLASKKLRVAPKLKLANVLREELGSFSRKAQKSDVMDPWRLGANDDLVLATTVALYASERFLHTTRAVELEDTLAGTPFDSEGSEGEG